jgi:phage-related protein
MTAWLGLNDDEYRNKLNQDEKIGKGMAGKIGKGLATAAKAAGVALAAAGTAVVAITKKSVEGFAEQEQLIGGVQKLYGNMGMSLDEYAKHVGKSTDDVKGEWTKLEKAQNIVLKNAKNAYKTAGMDMNTYMDTATSFSASLINALGGDTVKAAKQTDVAMRAISDNFNTFGGDIGMIKGAFQGFAKQNYTMLDNLKLGRKSMAEYKLGKIGEGLAYC